MRACVCVRAGGRGRMRACAHESKHKVKEHFTPFDFSMWIGMSDGHTKGVFRGVDTSVVHAAVPSF